MEVGADQGSVRPAIADRGVLDGISFAQSFDEGVGGAAEMLGNRPAGQVSTELQSLKDEPPPVKITNEALAVLPELKGKTVATGERPEYGAARGTDSRKTVPPQTVAVLGAQPKTIAGGLDTKDAQSLSDVECVTEDSSFIPQDVKGPSLKNDGFLRQVTIEGQSLAPSSDKIVVQKRNTRMGKTLESVPAEKNAKSQPGKIATTPHLVAIAPTPTLTTMAQGSDLRMGHPIEAVTTSAVVASAPPRGKPNSTSDGGLGDGVSAAGKSLLVGTTVMRDSLVQKNASGEKLPGDDTEATPSVVVDQAGSPKPGVGVEKLLSAATPAMDDNGVRTESTSGLSITVAHAMTGTTVVASNIVTRENSPSDANLIKLATGETGGRATGLPVGFREEDISGAVSGSIDRPQMLTGTPTALEVGIQSGTHGWLKVRAEMTETGVVNASVSASSTTGQEMLHRELPALTAYLQSEKVAVNAVTVHATAESRGGSTGMDGGNGGQTLQGGNEEGRRRQGVPETALNGADEAVTYESLNATDDNVALPLATYVGGGSWLSIRA